MPGRRSSTTRYIITGLVLYILGTTAYWLYVMEPGGLSGVSVAVVCPSEAVVGETVDLKVVLSNTQEEAIAEEYTIDLPNRYLEGFMVLTIEPGAQDGTAVMDTRSYEFFVEMAPGASWEVSYRMRVMRPGEFRGELDVWQGERYVTHALETTIFPAGQVQ
ncbi:MAG: hypothetical protein ACYTGQ_08760 [Planctomycetota bacterium]